MADKSKSLELKVGIFVFIGLVILAWFILMIGGAKLMRVGYNVDVVFSFANGIKIAAPVRVAGVDKGEVKEIKLYHEDDGRAKVVIKILVAGDTLIPQDSRAWVNTLGMLGEKYLEIIPGKDYKNIIPAHGVLVGEDPTSVQEVTDLVKDIGIQAKATLSDMQGTLTQLTAVLGDMHAGRGTIGRLFTDDGLYTDVAEMLADLKKNPWKLLYRPK